MKSARGRLRWAAAWGIATFLLWLAFRSVEWAGVGDAVAAAGKAAVIVALLLNASILVLWTLQWILFAPRQAVGDGPPPVRVFEVVTIMSTVSNSVPFLAGQATGVHLLATRGEVGHARALSVLALDQLAEGLAKVSVLALLALLVPLPRGLEEAAVVVAVGVTALAIGLVTVVWLRERHGASGETGVLAHVPGILDRGPVRAFAARFAEGLEALRSPRTLVAGVGLALAMKAAEGGAIVAVQHALGVEVPFWGTLLVLASVGLATMVAVAPANLGVYEASAFAAYRVVGVDPEAAAALALLQHALFLIPAAGTGWAVVALRGRRMWPGAVVRRAAERQAAESGTS